MGKIIKFGLLPLLAAVVLFLLFKPESEKPLLIPSPPPYGAAEKDNASGEDGLTISEQRLEQLLENGNKANVHATDKKNDFSEAFSEALKRGDVSQLPLPEVKRIVVGPDSFKHVEKDVIGFLEDWKVAWQNSAGDSGNIESFLACYADDFVSNGVAKKVWQKSKEKNNRRKRWIDVQFLDLVVEKITEDDKEVKVDFVQVYNSSNYSDQSKKQLILRQDGDKWFIAKETTVK